MTPDQQIRVHALNAAVERFKNSPAVNVGAETIVDSAAVYAIFISGDDTGNSGKPESVNIPGGGQRPKAAKS